MNKLWNFFKYNNAVPLTLGFIFLSAGAAFAASPEARDAAAAAVLSEQSAVVSVDNTYIVGKDLSAYSPRVEIVGVTEDEGTYYVDYKMQTIDVVDYVWRDVEKSGHLEVDKGLLRRYGDLGLYVTDQLKQNLSHEIDRLREVQEIEKRNVSQKSIATTYSGLLGKFLDDKTETLPGYVPVISSQDVGESPGETPGQISEQSSGESRALSLQVLGPNPIMVPLNTEYRDIGAVLSDPTDSSITYRTFVNGVEKPSPVIFSSTPAAFEIEYRARDQHGIMVIARRVVLAGGAPDPGTEISFAGSLAPEMPDTTTPPATPVETPVVPVSTAPAAATTPSEPPAEPVATTTPIDVPSEPATTTPSESPAAPAPTPDSAPDTQSTSTPAQ